LPGKALCTYFFRRLEFYLQIMTGARPSDKPASIRCRQIGDTDISQVVNLLTRGYAKARSREFWQHVLDGLNRRAVPAGYPRFGYLIESDGKLVGAIILIFSTVWVDGSARIRCNGSGLYVDPAFRIYAPLLTSKALKDKSVTVLNITAAPHTHKMVEATGFTRYSDGLFLAIPALSRPSGHGQVRVIDAHREPDVPFDPHERDLLLEHADYGCMSLWCVAGERAYPFVFRRRSVKMLPCAQLVYCRNVDDFVRFARPLGLHLLQRLQPFVILDANGPVPGLVGRYFEKGARYFLGPDRPRIGDLAYTETSLFGI
jgi:hypothetical protein